MGYEFYFKKTFRENCELLRPVIATMQELTQLFKEIVYLHETEKSADIRPMQFFYWVVQYIRKMRMGFRKPTKYRIDQINSG